MIYKYTHPCYIFAFVCLLCTACLCMNSHAETRLNSFVVEMVNQDNPNRSPYMFAVERAGWVFVRLEGASDNAAIFLIPSEGNRLSVPLHTWKPGMDEAMRFLQAGRYTIELTEGTADRLIVRRVPEIIYCRYHYDPWVLAEGPYDWAYLQRTVLPQVNTVIGTVNDNHEREATEWRARGGRWVAEMLAPGLNVSAGRHINFDDYTADDVFLALTDHTNIDQPWIDGLLLDEYLPKHKALFAPTIEAVRRIHQQSDIQSLRIDLYTINSPEAMSELLNGAIDVGSKIVMESYIGEQPTEDKALEVIQHDLTDSLKRYESVIDNCRHEMIIGLGYMSTPPETLNNQPNVNYRVFQDMQFQHLANEPAWRDVYGIMSYTSGYADRETIEWTARLYRHYCIEGGTTRLSDEPYLNNHLTNSDFTDALTGWDVTQAKGGGTVHKHIEGLGNLQSRWNADEVGDNCVVMTRSQHAPNVIAQTIQGLEPGQEYIVRFYSTSLQSRPDDY